MKYSKLISGLIIFLLLPAARGAAASPLENLTDGAALQSSALSTHPIQNSAPDGAAWQQVNASGFGDPENSAVSALAVFNNQLYAGTRNATNGAQIFRTKDGVTWSPVTQPGFGIAHDIRPPAILDLTVFRGRIYASTGEGDGPAQIWRSIDGSTWAPMIIHGFQNPDTVHITTLAEYNGYLYAGAGNLVNGAQVWRSFSGDNNSWAQVAPASGGSADGRVTGLAIFNSAIYAAVETSQTVQVWRSSGGAWTTVVSSGFGDSATRFSGELAEFGGFLYAGAGSATAGAQLWRSANGLGWQQAILPGFGDPDNQRVETLFTWQNFLYAGVKNSRAGMQVWRSADGASWEQVGSGGFGRSSNTGPGGVHSAAEFLGDLYVGTTNIVEGGELWRLQQAVSYFLPFVQR